MTKAYSGRKLYKVLWRLSNEHGFSPGRDYDFASIASKSVPWSWRIWMSNNRQLRCRLSVTEILKHKQWVLSKDDFGNVEICPVIPEPQEPAT